MAQALFLGLFLGMSLGLAQDTAHPVTFYCDPPDAQVLLTLPGRPEVVLGACGQPLPIPAGLLGGQEAILTFRRLGWEDASRRLPPGYLFRDRYPSVAVAPISLTPRPDPSSQLLRWQAFLFSHHPVSGVLLVLLGGLALGAARRAVRGRRSAPAGPGAEPTVRSLGKYRLHGHGR